MAPNKQQPKRAGEREGLPGGESSRGARRGGERLPLSLSFAPHPFGSILRWPPSPCGGPLRSTIQIPPSAERQAGRGNKNAAVPRAPGARRKHWLMMMTTTAEKGRPSSPLVRSFIKLKPEARVQRRERGGESAPVQKIKRGERRRGRGVLHANSSPPWDEPMGGRRSRRFQGALFPPFLFRGSGHSSLRSSFASPLFLFIFALSFHFSSVAHASARESVSISVSTLEARLPSILRAVLVVCSLQLL